MIAFIRFADVDARFLELLEMAAEFWRGRPGNVSVDVVRNVDDPNLAALVSRWGSIGDYRRALGGHEAKVVLTPVMVKALDEPSAYLPAELF